MFYCIHWFKNQQLLVLFDTAVQHLEGDILLLMSLSAGISTQLTNSFDVHLIAFL